jgi:hypothetical protein
LKVFPNSPQTKLYKRDFLLTNQLRFQEIDRFNDVFFNIASLAKASKISFVDEALVDYRVSNPDELILRHKNVNFQNYLLPWFALKEFFEREELYDEVYIAFTNALLLSIGYVYALLPNDLVISRFINFLNTKAQRIFQLKDIEPSVVDQYNLENYTALMKLLK